MAPENRAFWALISTWWEGDGSGWREHGKPEELIRAGTRILSLNFLTHCPFLLQTVPARRDVSTRAGTSGGSLEEV